MSYFSAPAPLACPGSSEGHLEVTALELAGAQAPGQGSGRARIPAHQLGPLSPPGGQLLLNL